MIRPLIDGNVVSPISIIEISEDNPAIKPFDTHCFYNLAVIRIPPEIPLSKSVDNITHFKYLLGLFIALTLAITHLKPFSVEFP
jgi:hypothetical protein